MNDECFCEWCLTLPGHLDRGYATERKAMASVKYGGAEGQVPVEWSISDGGPSQYGFGLYVIDPYQGGVQMPNEPTKPLPIKKLDAEAWESLVGHTSDDSWMEDADPSIYQAVYDLQSAFESELLLKDSFRLGIEFFNRDVAEPNLTVHVSDNDYVKAKALAAMQEGNITVLASNEPVFVRPEGDNVVDGGDGGGVQDRLDPLVDLPDLFHEFAVRIGKLFERRVGAHDLSTDTAERIRSALNFYREGDIAFDDLVT